jgi:hypothetical protein
MFLSCSNDQSGPGTGREVEEYSTQLALHEINKYDLHVQGGPEIERITLPKELVDANWSLKAVVCEKGGFNLRAYAGREVYRIAFDIRETCQGLPLTVYVLTIGRTCICAYKTFRGSDGPIPGVYALNEACE